MARVSKSGTQAQTEPSQLLRAFSVWSVSTLLTCALMCRLAHAEEVSGALTPKTQLNLSMFVDNDDDDDDGVADGASSTLSLRAATDVRWLTSSDRSAKTTAGPVLRLIAGDTPLELSQRAAPGVRLGLQALAPGVARVEFENVSVQANVVEVLVLDARGLRVDLATSHTPISRALPPELGDAQSGSSRADEDALRWVLLGPESALPASLTLVSLRPNGAALAALEQVALTATRCPLAAPPGLVCRQTAPIRAVWDVLEASHPSLTSRAIRAEVGGKISAFVGNQKAASVRVGGPRASLLGPLGRLKASVRLRLVRQTPGGPAPIGDDDASALRLARNELEAAGALWGQCGIHLGAPAQMDVTLVDPPRSALLSIGCDLGVPATGGEIRFSVDGRALSAKSEAGQTPMVVAQSVARVLLAHGFQVVVSPNAPISPGALRSVDLLVKTRKGVAAEISSLAGVPLSTDKSLALCLGEVDLTDGLNHFNDFNASAGTLEERALIKAYDDGDPTTIDVFVVPSFTSSGRIGESFIGGDGASIQNVVILDRAGIAAAQRSFTLAHELGHIFLDVPGHPDDFGVDHSTSLMDADASDPTIFGPRRLSVAECERAVRQSGPSSPLPLLSAWPLVEPALARVQPAVVLTNAVAQ